MTTGGARSAPGAGTLDAGVAPNTSPYPWPWDSRFSFDRVALLVIVGTDPAAPSGHPAWDVIAGLVEGVRRCSGLTVEVTTRRPSSQRFASWAEPEIDSLGAELQLAAPGWDGFFSTPLDSVLQSAGRDLLLLTGSWLETGVHSTMRSANDRGFECLLLTDACIADGPATQHGAISSVEMSGGIFGAVGTCTDVFPSWFPGIEKESSP